MKREQVLSNLGGEELRGRDEDGLVNPARPSDGLDRSIPSNSRADRVVDPAWRMVVWSIQLGHPPSWTVCSVHHSIKRA
ncbi:hypothetical protein F2Q70_00035659 [Brassica cretica]|uniref:Uncharacterized protein n=1 Tax=Brassica cretica TaxID=69181 RepID=A0A8S9K0U4_BRACR|nr:hypothetical protein F2Q70_00035659 [Brassica cretica]